MASFRSMTLNTTNLSGFGERATKAKTAEVEAILKFKELFDELRGKNQRDYMKSFTDRCESLCQENIEHFHSNQEKEENWKLEQGTWRLLEILFLERDTFDGIQTAPLNHGNISEKIIEERLYNKDDQFRLLVTIKKWLQLNFRVEDQPPVDINSLSHSGITDKESMKEFMRQIFLHLRSGEVEDAQDFAQRCSQSWLAAILDGLSYYNDKNAEESSMNYDEIDDVEGNINRKEWRHYCYEYATQSIDGPYERALFSVLGSCSSEALGVCDSFEDALWVFCTVASDIVLDKSLEEIGDTPTLPTPEYHRNQPENIGDIFAKMESLENPNIRADMEKPYHFVQAKLMLDDPEQCVITLWNWINEHFQGVVAPSDVNSSYYAGVNSTLTGAALADKPYNLYNNNYNNNNTFSTSSNNNNNNNNNLMLLDESMPQGTGLDMSFGGNYPSELRVSAFQGNFKPFDSNRPVLDADFLRFACHLGLTFRKLQYFDNNNFEEDNSVFTPDQAVNGIIVKYIEYLIETGEAGFDEVVALYCSEVPAHQQTQLYTLYISRKQHLHEIEEALTIAENYYLNVNAISISFIQFTLAKAKNTRFSNDKEGTDAFNKMTSAISLVRKTNATVAIFYANTFVRLYLLRGDFNAVINEELNRFLRVVDPFGTHLDEGSDPEIAFALYEYRYYAALSQAYSLYYEWEKNPKDQQLKEKCYEAFNSLVMDWLIENPINTQAVRLEKVGESFYLEIMKHWLLLREKFLPRFSAHLSKIIREMDHTKIFNAIAHLADKSTYALVENHPIMAASLLKESTDLFEEYIL